MALCTARPSFSLPVEQHIVTPVVGTWNDRDTVTAIANAAFTEAAVPYNLELPSMNFSIDPILAWESGLCPLSGYLENHDYYNDAKLARLISKAEYVSDTWHKGGVNLAELCILEDYPLAFAALHSNRKLGNLLGLACTKERSLLQVAIDDSFCTRDHQLPVSHPCYQLPPRDVFIGICLLSFVGTGEDWRLYLTDQESIDRVAAVETRLLSPTKPRSRL